MFKKTPVISVAKIVILMLFVPTTAFSAEPIKVLKAPKNLDSEKVALGRLLFFDKRLSKDNTKSCHSCHNLKRGGDDDLKVSKGVDGRAGNINSPTVYNSGKLFRQFWDGRAATLEHQVNGPVQNPVEMASLWPDVIAKLLKDTTFTSRFTGSYPSGIKIKNITHAIAEFERSLVTVNSPFDQYLKGNRNAISAKARAGYKLFKSYGCTSCHQGEAVGGNMYQVFGVVNSYFKKRGNITEADFGRYNLTGNRVDIHSFKVPSLRLVAHTAPYFHDGSANTLREAVDTMFEFQLGRKAPSSDKEKIVSFLRTLAGEHKEFRR